MFKNKKVLVTGSSGMIGRELVLQLKKLGASVRTADIKEHWDLTNYGHCFNRCSQVDYVFHLAGIKGNPKMTQEQPLDFFEPMILFNTNMIKAARNSGVKKFLYTSSIAVENMESDFYPAWAKLTGEHHVKASGMDYIIARPANVYGRYDDLSKEHLMVVSDLIKKARDEPFLEIWGDGSTERDFINSKDCARGMIEAMTNLNNQTINLCSGIAVKIRDVAEFIAKQYKKKIVFDKTKPTGAKRRVMDLDWDFKPEIDIFKGIKEIIECKRK